MVSLTRAGGGGLAKDEEVTVLPIPEKGEKILVKLDGRGQVSLAGGRFPAAFFFFFRSVRLAPLLNFPSLLRGQYLHMTLQ